MHFQMLQAAICGRILVGSVKVVEMMKKRSVSRLRDVLKCCGLLAVPVGGS